MWMIFFVLDDPDRLDEVLEAWTQAGVRGVTILESSGYHRKRRKFIPMRYAQLSDQDMVEGNCTLYAIVEHEATVEASLKATEALVGDLDQPNTGVFASWPLGMVKGLAPQPPMKE